MNLKVKKADLMDAGRELDALVAEHVLGKKVELYKLAPSPYYRFVETEEGIPHYSTDFSDAWRLVDHLERKGIYLWKLGREDVMPDWVADFGRNHKPSQMALAKTPALAICRAALKIACEL